MSISFCSHLESCVAGECKCHCQASLPLPKQIKRAINGHGPSIECQPVSLEQRESVLEFVFVHFHDVIAVTICHCCCCCCSHAMCARGKRQCLEEAAAEIECVKVLAFEEALQAHNWMAELGVQLLRLAGAVRLGSLRAFLPLYFQSSPLLGRRWRVVKVLERVVVGDGEHLVQEAAACGEESEVWKLRGERDVEPVPEPQGCGGTNGVIRGEGGGMFESYYTRISGAVLKTIRNCRI